jgi:hypothetical protein
MECICHPTTRRDMTMTDAPSWTEWTGLFEAAGL